MSVKLETLATWVYRAVVIGLLVFVAWSAHETRMDARRTTEQTRALAEGMLSMNEGFKRQASDILTVLGLVD